MHNAKLHEWAEAKNYRVACAAPGHLEYVKARLESQLRSRAINPEFFQQWLTEFQYPDDAMMRKIKSLIFIAVPRPAHILTFQLPDRVISTILPPTYGHYRELFEIVRNDFATQVAGEQYEAMILSVPLKSLSARIGFLHYGRNNIGYVQGLGSYFQLMCLATTVPLEPDYGAGREANDEPQQMLENCRDCKRCIDACTVGAIPSDRFLLHAEQCYTAFSESAKPIPENLQSPSPQCLIGCMQCQWICPANRNLLRYEQLPVSFTSEETELMLNESQLQSSSLGSSIASKFASLGLTESYSVLIRNLRFLHNPNSKLSSSDSDNHRERSRASLRSWIFGVLE